MPWEEEVTRKTFLLTAIPAVLLIVGGLALLISPSRAEISRVAETTVAAESEPEHTTAQLAQWRTMRAELDGVGPREAVSLANEWRGEAPDVFTTLTTRAVEFRFPDGRQVDVPLDADQMAVSVAPYRNRTHPCVEHSIVGCRGEIPGRAFDVTVTVGSGEVLLSESVTTGDNGFFELWLPRDETVNLRIDSSLGNAEKTITTTDDAATCITDMQLL